MTPELLDLIADGESERVEFEADPSRIHRTVAALLNTSGGVVLVGVDDDGSLNGVEHASSVAADI